MPQTSSISETYKLEDYSDIVSQSLMEVLYMFSRGEDPMREIAVTPPSDREDSPNSQASPMLSPVAAAALPPYPASTLPLPSGSKIAQPKSFLYLLDCYTRVAIEERNHPKVEARILFFISRF